MKKKILSVLFIMVLSTFGAATVFAEETKENKQKIENQVVGKITAINSNYVTIDVALPNKREKNDIKNETENKEKFDVKKEVENKENREIKDGIENGEKRSKDNMFTLTGESKRINISKAKFMGSKKIIDTNNNNNNEKSKELTYSDFSVGDYIMIVLADDGSNVAKIVKKDGLARKRPNKTIEKK